MVSITTTVLTISAITGTLALLLSIANRTIANYGEKNININEEKDYLVDGGDTLLSALVEKEIYIPSACGGKGSCGYCKVKVIEGGGQILPTELGYVTGPEQKEGIRLSCQCKVKEDMKIEIPEELFNVKQFDYDIEFMNDVTPKIKHLRLKLPKDAEINFKAGQYVQVLAPKYKGNREEVYRAYSIASSPHDNTALELFIGYIPQGVCTTYIHQHLKTEDQLTVVGPYGDFFYREGDKKLIMVAIGTGMAPIMSILKYMRDEKIDREVEFYFGARTRSDLYLMDELRQLESDLPGLKVLTCLSRPTEACQWLGDKGRVTQLIQKYLTDGEHCEAYLCGSPVMIDSVIPELEAKGVLPESIFYDKFE